MKNIQQEVVEWHKSCFPNATDDAILNKFLEEICELQIEVIRHEVSSGQRKQISEELADVIIVGCSLLSRWDKDLEAEVLRKLEINKDRKWGPENEIGDRPRDK